MFYGEAPIRNGEFQRLELEEAFHQCFKELPKSYRLAIIALNVENTPIFEIEREYFGQKGIHGHDKRRSSHAHLHLPYDDLFYYFKSSLIEEVFDPTSSLEKAKSVI